MWVFPAHLTFNPAVLAGPFYLAVLLLVQRFFTQITWAVVTSLLMLVNRSGEKRGYPGFLLFFFKPVSQQTDNAHKSQFPYNALCFAVLLLKVVKEEKHGLSQIRK